MRRVRSASCFANTPPATRAAVLVAKLFAHAIVLGFVALISLSIAAIIPAVDDGRLATAVAGTPVLIAGSLAAALVAFRRREL